MKKTIKKFHILVFFLGITMISGYSYSQDLKTDKQARKNARKLERELDFHNLGSLLESRKFVLKIEQDTNDGNLQLNSQLNYLKIDSLISYFQTEHKYSFLLRQVPDQIIEGKVERWNLVKDNKHFSYHLDFKMSTWFGLFTVFMIIESDKITSGSIILKEDTFSFYGHIAKI
jgi:hypothetical protein